MGSLRNDSQLNTPKAILIDLIRALPVCLIILAVGLILLTMQLNISELLWSFSKKLAIFWLVRRVLVPTGIYDFVWHPALFNTALYCCLFYLISRLFV